MYGDFLNFEQLSLLHLWLHRPETCRDTSKWDYLHCVKILSKKSLIGIFDEVIANQELRSFTSKNVSLHGFIKRSDRA